MFAEWLLCARPTAGAINTALNTMDRALAYRGSSKVAVWLEGGREGSGGETRVGTEGQAIQGVRDHGEDLSFYPK